MPVAQTHAVLHSLRRLAQKMGYDQRTDRQLLESFAFRGDQGAFAALLDRHGELVKRVCVQVLQHEQDAEDAFQATFLVLAQKSRRPGWQASIRSWLFQAAWRTASTARTLRQRRRFREQQAPPLKQTGDDVLYQERHDIVREEVLRLPDRYRCPLWLCYWEGQSQEEACAILGCSEGSLRGRLHRAKNVLRERLRRRGITLAGALPAVPMIASECLAVSQETRIALLDTVERLSGGESLSRLVSTTILTLMKGAIGPMFTTRCQWAVTGLFLAALVSAGFLNFSGNSAESNPVLANPAPVPALAPVGGQKVQEGDWQNLLADLDVEKNRVGQGIWRLKGGKLIGYPAAHGARLRIPLVPKGDYELKASWESKFGDSSAHIILPHGNNMAVFDFMPRLECVGFGDLNGVRSDVNETRKDMKLEPGKIYNIYVRMKTVGDMLHVLAKVNGKVVVDWEGKRAEVDHEFFAPPKPASLGVSVSGQSSTFHSLELRMLSGKVEPWTGKKASTTLQIIK